MLGQCRRWWRNIIYILGKKSNVTISFFLFLIDFILLILKIMFIFSAATLIFCFDIKNGEMTLAFHFWGYGLVYHVQDI